MLIKTLAENESVSREFKSEHGLSLYIETINHKLMFDLGASALFIENAKKMGVDLSDVDTVVISHGHYDHGGGLKPFLDVNSKAKIYLNQRAFEKHYGNRAVGGKAYIGLDAGLLPDDRFVFTGDHLVIDDELELFSGVNGVELVPTGNQDLFMEAGASLVPDDFAHEQDLIIHDGGKKVLIAGCAHKGIVNIINHFISIKKCRPDYVIGGFHLYNRSSGADEDPALIGKMGEYLRNTGSKYYTCHCTGIRSYEGLKEIIGEDIQYLATGSQLTI